MKKSKGTIIHVVNWCLLFSLPVMLLTVKVNTDEINSISDTKKLSTNLFSSTDVVPASEIKEEVIEESDDLEEVSELEQEKASKEVSKKEVEEKSNSSNSQVVPSPSITEQSKEEKTTIITTTTETPVSTKSDVLASYTGNMSFYNANCTGCSGITSTGVDVSDGRLYYQDSQYGSVRIVAAGTEIKKWSIIRIKNSSLGSSVLAIVLDRGGDIGAGRRFLIDMLTNSSENKGGVNYGITVEVLRNGK